jgi:hypothetical protein
MLLLTATIISRTGIRPLNYRDGGNQLKQKINELVELEHEEHPDWSLTKIAKFIIILNQDIDGFSSKIVTRHM